MKKLSKLLILFALVLVPGCKQPIHSTGDIWDLALARKSDLRISVYVTAHTVEQMFTTETGRREVVSLLHANGITKVYLEVYRSGLVISPGVIKRCVSFLKENGFEVVGGIAPVPGGGFVQPYEGFINFRWISTLAGNKTGGAWFDHGDCTDIDFIEQAYQSVLAGAKELVIFNFDSFVTGHPGHHLLRQDFEKLADLGKTISKYPVEGAVGYKPPNSDAGGDLYLMDYIGMFGVSLVPDSKYPENAQVIFLPTQAATDQNILAKIEKSLANRAKIVITAGFIANSNCGEQLAHLAQIKWPLPILPTMAETIISDGNPQKLKFPLIMDYQLIPDGADILLPAAGENNNAFMTRNQVGKIFVLNTHTFSQKDFDEVGEVLLCPRQLGLLELPKPWINSIRSAFRSEDEPVIDAPSRVSMQQLSDRSFIIHNYNQENTTLNILLPRAADYSDGFTGKSIPSEGKDIKLVMSPRTRIWFRVKNQ